MCDFGGLTSPLLLHAFSLHNPAHRFGLEGILICVRWGGLHVTQELHLGHLRQEALLQLYILRHVLALLMVLRLHMGVGKGRRLLSSLNELLL